MASIDRYMRVPRSGVEDYDLVLLRRDFGPIVASSPSSIFLSLPLAGRSAAQRQAVYGNTQGFSQKFIELFDYAEEQGIDLIRIIENDVEDY